MVHALGNSNRSIYLGNTLAHLKRLPFFQSFLQRS